MAKAVFKSGEPNMVPHTPTAAIAAGDIVIQGATIMIAHAPIPANQPGFMSVGPGIYTVTGNFTSLAAGAAALYTVGTPGTFAATGTRHFGSVLAAANGSALTRDMFFNQSTV